MKVARVQAPGGAPVWAVVDPDAGTARPLAGGIADWGSSVTASPPWAGEPMALESLRLLAPLEPGAKVVGAGATYAKHIEGLGLKMPEQPAAFLKPAASIIGPGDEIAYPALTEQLDYEAELVVVVGPGRSILGYTAGNEVSARDLQFGGAVTGMDLFSAKALDRTAPVGPWIVTRDEFGDQSPDLELTLHVDGEERQHDRTGNLVWGVDELLNYVDARSRMHPGDLLWTGTPAGVGHEDGRYLQPGQEVVVTIERIGELRNVVGAHG